MTVDLRLGDYRTVLADVTEVDAVICDPPYSARTHSGQCASPISSGTVGYRHIGPDDVRVFVEMWAPLNRGWFAVWTDTELAPHFQSAFRDASLYAFAPVPCVMRGMSVRISGDGPSSWCVWLVVARPKRLVKWGTLPGAYIGNPFDAGQNTCTAGRRSSPINGSKPVWLASAIVRDYSRPGDLICDPFAGGGTTLLAAQIEGRRAIGAEIDPDTHRKAAERLARGYTPAMF